MRRPQTKVQLPRYILSTSDQASIDHFLNKEVREQSAAIAEPDPKPKWLPDKRPDFFMQQAIGEAGLNLAVNCDGCLDAVTHEQVADAFRQLGAVVKDVTWDDPNSKMVQVMFDYKSESVPISLDEVVNAAYAIL